ncbi:MAG: carbamoyl phosphate synthase large subunit, partial [Syntrophales bacterium]|nr:carbamoyl phosphate synthase large subunit [Syntrophales bacterium]
GMAYAKSQMAAGFPLPTEGTLFISVHDHDKERIVPVAAQFRDLGFRLVGTRGTATYLAGHGLPTATVKKLSEGRPHVVDRIKSGEIHLVINTSVGRRASLDGYSIRRGALTYHVPYTTTVAGARAMAAAIAALKKGDWDVRPLQEYYVSPP